VVARLRGCEVNRVQEIRVQEIRVQEIHYWNTASGYLLLAIASRWFYKSRQHGRQQLSVLCAPLRAARRRRPAAAACRRNFDAAARRLAADAIDSGRLSWGDLWGTGTAANATQASDQTRFSSDPATRTLDVPPPGDLARRFADWFGDKTGKVACALRRCLRLPQHRSAARRAWCRQGDARARMTPRQAPLLRRAVLVLCPRCLRGRAAPEPHCFTRPGNGKRDRRGCARCWLVARRIAAWLEALD
jgi:hypothetical protein